MNLIERIDEARARWNVLDHPFYLRWERGELSRDELAFYAGEYRHAVVALADAAAAAGDAEHAAEESAHVALWDDFAAALDAPLDREPTAETRGCADAWRRRRPTRGARGPLRRRVRAAGHLPHEAHRPGRALRLSQRNRGHRVLRAPRRARPRARRRSKVPEPHSKSRPPMPRRRHCRQLALLTASTRTVAAKPAPPASQAAIRAHVIMAQRRRTSIGMRARGLEPLRSVSPTGT